MDNSRCWFLFAAALVLAIALNPARVFAAPTWETMRPIQTMLNNATLAASATGRIKNLPGGKIKYTTVSAPVTLPAVREQAVKALKRGKVHPAMLAATVAGGLLIDGDTGDILEENDTGDLPDVPTELQGEALVWGNTASISSSICGYSGNPDNTFNEALDRVISERSELQSMTWTSCGNDFDGAPNILGYFEVTFTNSSGLDDEGSVTAYRSTTNGEPLTQEQIEGQPTVIDESDYPEKLDPYLEPVLPDLTTQIADDSESDWANDLPPEIESDDGLPQSLVDAIEKAMANAEAQENGEDEPHPDEESTTQDADDQLVDELTEPPTDLPEEPEAEWEVNEYDSITPEDVNVGSDSCPAPYVIDLVGDLPSVEITFDYICDFADYVRWFFLAGAWILAGTIVIRE